MGISTPIWRKPLFLSYWAPPALWGLAVLCMSGDLGSGKNTLGILKWLLSWFVALEPDQLKLINFYSRKTGHVMAYGFMGFLWFRAFRWHASYGLWRACFWSLGFCVLFASLDEGRQWFYASRGASVYDVLLDMSGAGLTALVTAAIWRPRRLAAPRPTVSWWGRPHVLYFWLPPVLWTLAVLAMLEGLVPVKSTLVPLKWFVSWFAIVDSYDLKILNLYMWKIGQVLTFGILYVFWFRALQGDVGAPRGSACLFALGLCLLVAIMNEGLHTFTRIQGVYDVILDMSGSGLAALVTAAVWTPRRHVLTVPGIAGRQTRQEE